MNGISTITVLIGCVAAIELLAFVGLLAGHRRTARRARQLDHLWERHRHAVEHDVAYLNEWQDFLGSFAGDLSEGERG